MSQRISRNSKKNNNLNFVSMGTGSHVTRHTPDQPPQVQVEPPMKATGDIKLVEPESEPVKEVPQAGIAKASPNFKPLAPASKPVDKDQEKKVIAENTKPVDEDEKDE